MRLRISSDFYHRHPKTNVRDTCAFSQLWHVFISIQEGAAEEEFTTSTTPDRSDKKIQGFESLSEEDKEKVRGIVYIMVRFSVSHEAYHELTQVVGGEQLPRSYLVEGCTKFLDSKLYLRKTPGTCPGAELPVKDLLETEIRNCVSLQSTRTLCLFCLFN